MNETNAEKYTGQTRMMNCGMNATVIVYRNSKDIDIQFENGTVRKHVIINSFLKGNISYKPQCTKNDYIGQTRTMNCGMKATIIKYRRYKDIDVQFEDNTIREHVSISSFSKGNISPPSTSIQPKNKHIGETRTMNCGLKATVIAYRTYKDVDIQFENGIIRKHRGLDEFERRAISPIPPRKGVAIIGRTKMMNCGMKATITEYRNIRDIDVRFENGVVRKHLSMCSFNSGTISPKDIYNTAMYIGQTTTMICGMKATVIAYRKNNDIDIQFEDGTIREHVNMYAFRNGKISITPRQQIDYMNKTRKMNNDMKATIISYNGHDDITIKFEDGTIKEHMSTTAFNKGGIAHPTNILFDTYKLGKVAFQFHDKTYFYVTYTENDSEISEVMCIDDMKNKLPELA